MLREPGRVTFSTGARRIPATLIAGLIAALAILLLAPAAQADRGIVGYIGGSAGFGPGQLNIPRGLAINESGAGSGAEAGDIYVGDDGEGNVRVDQFHADGTFVRAFGWGVVDGSNAFQICTTKCQGAVEPSPPAAPGSIGNAGDSLAVDQTNGDVFVNDAADVRINVYGSDGTFQGAFGWGVATGASELEFCTTACRAGTQGSAGGQLAGFDGLGMAPSGGDLY
ncbi:MAG TPA: hypothetical protein VG518_03180, partial [Solirubrobacterales bacterium]|nr:hypothetical protein [Solirubrobacterales bacterium]